MSSRTPQVKLQTIPTYKSHKKVQAFKIERIEPTLDQRKIVMTAIRVRILPW